MTKRGKAGGDGRQFICVGKGRVCRFWAWDLNRPLVYVIECLLHHKIFESWSVTGMK
jgi:hypothetical protein